MVKLILLLSTLVCNLGITGDCKFPTGTNLGDLEMRNWNSRNYKLF